MNTFTHPSKSPSSNLRNVIPPIPFSLTQAAISFATRSGRSRVSPDCERRRVADRYVERWWGLMVIERQRGVQYEQWYIKEAEIAVVIWKLQEQSQL
jgi:hypothetical protein